MATVCAANPQHGSVRQPCPRPAPPAARARPRRWPCPRPAPPAARTRPRRWPCPRPAPPAARPHAPPQVAMPGRGAAGPANFTFDRVYSKSDKLFPEMIVNVLDRYFQVQQPAARQLRASCAPAARPTGLHACAPPAAARPDSATQRAAGGNSFPIRAPPHVPLMAAPLNPCRRASMAPYWRTGRRGRGRPSPWGQQPAPGTSQVRPSAPLGDTPGPVSWLPPLPAVPQRVCLLEAGGCGSQTGFPHAGAAACVRLSGSLDPGAAHGACRQGHQA
jgi:hypothetical protein